MDLEELEDVTGLSVAQLLGIGVALIALTGIGATLLAVLTDVI
jgi:hypothetical protein